MAASVLQLYRKVAALPFGDRLFSRLVCWEAPYFGSIVPTISLLEPGRAEAWMSHRRGVTNHLGTLHAIALCNLAEFVGGLMTDASIPTTMRWIPKGMSVQYLKKAVGRQHAVATPGFAPHHAIEGYELPVDVVVVDRQGEPVFRATISMWVSPRTAFSG